MKAEEENFRKSIYKKYAPRLQRVQGDSETVSMIQAEMQREHLQRQKKWLLDSYPLQARDSHSD